MSALVSGLGVAVLLGIGSLFHPLTSTVASPLAVVSDAFGTTPIEPIKAAASVDSSPVASGAATVEPVSTPVATPALSIGSIPGEAAPPLTPDLISVVPTLAGGAAGTAAPPKTPTATAFQSRTVGVPILMYHYIRVNPVASDGAGYNLSVTPRDFGLQMRFLSTHGFTPVSMATLREHVRNKAQLPPNPVVITFDDGYADSYIEALPTLQRFHFIATFYIVTGFVDLPRYVTWDQVAAMDRDGMEIASHTVHHVGLTVIGALQRQIELVDSRAVLEKRLSRLILDFCYPSGEVNAAAEIAVARAGYLSATTTVSGRADVGTDPLRLPRIRVWGGESLTTFADVLGLKTTAADFADS